MNKISWHTPSTDLGTHICIKLINLVKQHPMIYLSSKESALYPRKNRNEINQIWDNIAKDIGLSVEDCKRRWKGLKDVYAKIRKRRLQEGVLGINARKKWLYEDVMSFMKFPFEKPYQKALENFEEVDCNEWRMDDGESNDTLEDTLNDSNDTLALTNSEFKEDDESKIEEQAEQIEDGTIEYLDLDLEVDSVPDSEGYEQTQILEKENSSVAEGKSHVQVSMVRENSGAGVKGGSRYRAIRPKPYQPNLLGKNRSVRNGNAVGNKNNSSCMTNPVVNLSNLNPLNQIVVTSPTLNRRKNCDAVMLASPNMKVRTYGKEAGDGVTSTSQAGIKSNCSKNMRVDSSGVLKNSDSPLHITARNSSSSSVELFFQSMAQTVMNLPMKAQAEIKMEICRVVTRAEIQHSISQTNSNLESHKSKSKKG